MPPRRWPIYLVGTPRGRLSKLEKQFLERPWGQVKQSVEVKLLPREGELYILARSERSEEHTSELQSRLHLVCRLLLEKKNNNRIFNSRATTQWIRTQSSTDVRRQEVAPDNRSSYVGNTTTNLTRRKAKMRKLMLHPPR